jgi:hypothetical protein
MSLIGEFRGKVSGYEGYAQAFIVSKKMAIISHAIAFGLGVILGGYFF